MTEYGLPKLRGHRIRLTPHPGSPDPNDENAVRAWLQTRPRPWAIDLFCGAGGLSLGLEEAGFSVVSAADSDPTSTETHSSNMQSLTWTGDLADPTDFLNHLDAWGIDNIELLAGGPPCQPFSRAGIPKIGDLVRRGRRHSRDERADLWWSFFSIVDRLKPSAVLFENVPDFARAQGGALLTSLISELRSRSYGVTVDVLDAWRYRVPQHRSRLFVVAFAGNRGFEWPRPRGRRPTVWQAIGDLPVVAPGTREEEQPYHGPPHSVIARWARRGLRGPESRIIRDHVTRSVRTDDAQIYALLEPGDTYLNVPEHLRRYRSDIFNDKYLRLSFDGLARTITAHIAKDGYWYIHPAEDRTLSIREAARIQTFPDRFRFAGHPSSRYRQIGNAVPPMLASAIGSSMLESLHGGPVNHVGSGLGEHCVSDVRADLMSWFANNGRWFPWREPGLSPWQVLLIEMCLHRTRADQVARVADELLTRGVTPTSFLEHHRSLEPLLKTLGLRWRSENLASAAEYIDQRLDGRVPANWEGLVAIPGVGDYIASAVLCFAFDHPTVIMDTNTERIARRVMGEDCKQPIWKLRLLLNDLAGHAGADGAWNQSLLDLGALICTAHRPRCHECPVRPHCATGNRNMSSEE